MFANVLDNDFATISMMRRAINLSTSESRSDSFYDNIFVELSTVLRILLPGSSTGRIEAFVRSIFMKAVSLSDAMSREEFTYRCFFLQPGEELDKHRVKFTIKRDNESSGLVHLCTFPGLSRTIPHERKFRTMRIVKATVKVMKTESNIWI